MKKSVEAQEKQEGVDKYLAAAVIGLFVLAIGAGAYISLNKSRSAPQTAVEIADDGDVVEINYIGRLDTGAVFDTSYADIARNESAEKVSYFQLRGEYAPLHFVVGSGEMISGVDEGVIGMKVGGEKVLTVPPEKGYGFSDPARIQTIPKKQEIDRFVTLEAAEFISTFGKAPVVGESVNVGVNVSVINVTSDSVTIEYNMKKGETLEPYGNPWNTSVHDVTEDKIVLLHDFKEGMIYTAGGRYGKVISVGSESAVFDFNSPLAGKTLTFEIRLESLTKFNMSKVVSEDAPSLGPRDAKVVVVEFSDFQCPYCGAVAGKNKQVVQQMQMENKEWVPQVPELEELAKQGKIRLIFRHFPLTSIHADAQKAAEASECAHEQGKFWEYHDLLLENQDKLKAADLKGYAEKLGLDKEKFARCLDDGVKFPRVSQDLKDGTDLGISGTPTFFIGGKRILNAGTLFSEFEQIINRKLEEAH